MTGHHLRDDQPTPLRLLFIASGDEIYYLTITNIRPLDGQNYKTRSNCEFLLWKYDLLPKDILRQNRTLS